jgi:hypothetical protein
VQQQHKGQCQQPQFAILNVGKVLKDESQICEDERQHIQSQQEGDWSVQGEGAKILEAKERPV